MSIPAAIAIFDPSSLWHKGFSLGNARLGVGDHLYQNAYYFTSNDGLLVGG